MSGSDVQLFNWGSAMTKIMSEFSDGPYFKSPNLAPAMVIVDGIPASVDAKLHVGPVKESPIRDVWNDRRPAGK